jgi:hypothetical protein
MRLDGWKLVVVLVALIVAVGLLGWHGILDAKSVCLALSTIVAWVIPSPLAAKLENNKP